MLSLGQLAKGLGMDKSNLHKVVRKLGIVGSKMRGERNVWEMVLQDKDIEKVLKYREGIPHMLVKTKNGFEIKEAAL